MRNPLCNTEDFVGFDTKNKRKLYDMINGGKLVSHLPVADSFAGNIKMFGKLSLGKASFLSEFSNCISDINFVGANLCVAFLVFVHKNLLSVHANVVATTVECCGVWQTSGIRFLFTISL